MSKLTALDVLQRHTLDHARLLRKATEHLRSPRNGDTAALIAAIEALAAEQDQVAELLEACAVTDNPLEGAAILCEMQSYQRSPGTLAERAWSGMAEVLRRQLALLNTLPVNLWASTLPQWGFGRAAVRPRN